ncbi:MAG: hypothetical protein HYV97_20080 [Bdellovibrio sp.]|nr:hypothetical protein [Bdellovibrio sp.]
MESEIGTQLTFQHGGNAFRIFLSAIDTLGEEVNFVRWRLSQACPMANLNLEFPSCSDWFTICEQLYMDVGFFQFGYSKKLHEICIWKAIRKGKFYFRITPQIETIIDRMSLREENNWKWQIEHSGDPYRSTIIKKWQAIRQTGYIGERQPQISAHIEKLYLTYLSNQEAQFTQITH